MREAVLTASATSFPSFSMPTLDRLGTHANCTREAITAFRICGVPLSGTCTALMAAAALNFSELMCAALPMPAVA